MLEINDRPQTVHSYHKINSISKTESSFTLLSFSLSITHTHPFSNRQAKITMCVFILFPQDALLERLKPGFKVVGECLCECFL